MEVCVDHHVLKYVLLLPTARYIAVIFISGLIGLFIRAGFKIFSSHGSVDLILPKTRVWQSLGSNTALKTV